jgi:hypothetical protein
MRMRHLKEGKNRRFLTSLFMEAMDFGAFQEQISIS